MSITADLHTHSHHSADSTASMESMVEAAIRSGLKEICFTEHYDCGYPVSEEAPEGTWDLNTDSYLYELLHLRDVYKDHIKILFGVELGLSPDAVRTYLQYVRGFDLDYVIGSIHLIGGKDPYYRGNFADMSDEDLYRLYFKETLVNIRKFSNFDSLGHLDYIVRYGESKDRDYSYDKYKDVIDPILEYLLENEKGLEVNSAGLRHGLAYPNPCKDIIQRYHDLGGELITIGSDAHKPEDVAKDFDVIASLLTDCGFRYYVTYENRLPEYHRI
ncbi:MAG: histidinol-phosphatase HisJ family protein [Lachnospiraceae bacterium]|nr:histidinol-phosphatase HisJ family protein [Lachnospiraceae bacterium]